MDALVVDLDAVGPRHAAEVGWKAARLGALRAAGFPVPEGLCVTTAAFRRAVAPLARDIAAVEAQAGGDGPAAAALRAAAMAEVLAGITVPADAARAIDAAWRPSLSDVPLAVRSSATAEDLEGASFAGQYETVLGVRGRDLPGAITACWRSFFAPGARAARTAAGRAPGADAMAVLIQPLVPAECAGVCFTLDPVERRRDRIVISAVWGLGAGAVDGTVPADTVSLGRVDLQVVDRRIVDKGECIALDPAPSAAAAPRREAVPEQRRRAACLPPAWARRVAEFALEAERLAGTPQDIEWSIAGDRLWILQARPIAGLPPGLACGPGAFPTPDELIPGWQRQGGPAPDKALEQDIRWGGFRAGEEAALRNGAEWAQQRLYLAGRAYVRRVPSELGQGDRRVREAARRERAAALRAEGTTPWGRLQPEVSATVRRLGGFDPDGADGPALAAHLEEAFGANRYHWTLHWVMAAEMGDCLAPFRQAVEAASGLAGEEGDALCQLLVDGEDTVLTRLIDHLYALGRMAAGIPVARALVEDAPADALDRLHALVGPRAVVWRAGIEALLAEHGARCGAGFGSEGGLHTPTWQERPDLVLRLMRPYLDPAVEAPGSARARAREARDGRVAALCAGAKDPAAALEVRRLLPFARQVKADLENHNHFIDQMARGQLRRAIAAAGRHLVARGALAEPGEVWWLHRHEVVAALRTPGGSGLGSGLGADPGPDLRETIEARRAQHEAWLPLEAPAAIGVPDAALDPRPPLRDEVSQAPAATAKHGLLRGQGASPGRARGRARVCDGRDLLPAVAPGEILVARNAGPQWTPLFPVLGGLVLEEGVLFQHAASTAREYGIPAVIRVGGATGVADGAWMTVDGTVGQVEVEGDGA